MRNLNDELGYDEVTVTRDEVAHVMAVAAQFMLDATNVPDELEGTFKGLLASYGALVMVKMFDEGKIDKLEVE